MHSCYQQYAPIHLDRWILKTRASYRQNGFFICGTHEMSKFWGTIFRTKYQELSCSNCLPCPLFGRVPLWPICWHKYNPWWPMCYASFRGQKVVGQGEACHSQFFHFHSVALWLFERFATHVEQQTQPMRAPSVVHHFQDIWSKGIVIWVVHISNVGIWQLRVIFCGNHYMTRCTSLWCSNIPAHKYSVFT